MYIGNWQDLAPILTALTGVIATTVKVAQYLKNSKNKGEDAKSADDLESKVENLTTVCTELLKEIDTLKKIMEAKNKNA